MIKRIVKLSKTNSFFLFGPRSTGKTTLISQLFSDQNSLYLDLLDPDLFDRLEQRPSDLKGMIDLMESVEWVIIDEIQKVPALLDVIHSIDSKNRKIKFILTGSSDRKLKRGGANLLAGRAFKYNCHPLIFQELDHKFDLADVLHFGSLPKIFSLHRDSKVDFLRAYVETYFKEEIVAEQLVRNLRPFKGFLAIAAQMNGQIININRIAKDIGVEHPTVQNYFDILEDTMVGFLLEPYHLSIRKRQRQQSKFYYFDIGVQRALTKQLENTLHPGTTEYGNAFEHFIIIEIKRMIDYFKPDWTMSYLRTKDNAEIDLIIERPGMTSVAIEIKPTNNIHSLDATKLNSTLRLFKDLKDFEYFILNNDHVEKKEGDVLFLHWKNGLKKLGFF